MEKLEQELVRRKRENMNKKSQMGEMGEGAEGQDELSYVDDGMLKEEGKFKPDLNNNLH